MRTFKLLIASALLAASMSAPADEPIGIAQELLASGYSFPSSETGTLEVKACTSCATMRFQLTAKTKFLAGPYQVSLAKLSAVFEENPEALTLLMLETNRRDVMSLSIQIAPAPAGR